jgi:hypothetical protein
MPDQPSTVNVPLPQYIADAAHAAGLAAAQAVIDRHVATCDAPKSCKAISKEVQNLKLRLAVYMAAGGASVWTLLKIFG